MRTKLLTIALSAAITSVAGTFYVQYYFFVDPDVAFGPSVSIQAILPAVIGGVATIWGPAIGALVLGPLNDVTATLLRNPPEVLDFLQGRAGLDVIVYAVLFILVAGALTPDAGTVHLEGRDVTGLAPHRLSRAGMSRTFQLMKPFASMS